MRLPVRSQRDRVGLNMTPMIDVVFLLIIFFMLVNRIVTNETVQMIVPELDNPKTQELGEVKKIVVNIAPEEYSRDDRKGNPLDWPGEPAYVQVGQPKYRFKFDDPELTKNIADTLTNELKGAEEVQVLLRADCAVYYDAVQQVMKAITRAEHTEGGETKKITTVNLVAYMPDRSFE